MLVAVCHFHWRPVHVRIYCRAPVIHRIWWWHWRWWPTMRSSVVHSIWSIHPHCHCCWGHSMQPNYRWNSMDYRLLVLMLHVKWSPCCWHNSEVVYAAVPVRFIIYLEFMNKSTQKSIPIREMHKMINIYMWKKSHNLRWLCWKITISHQWPRSAIYSTVRRHNFPLSISIAPFVCVCVWV